MQADAADTKHVEVSQKFRAHLRNPHDKDHGKLGSLRGPLCLETVVSGLLCVGLCGATVALEGPRRKTSRSINP